MKNVRTFFSVLLVVLIGVSTVTLANAQSANSFDKPQNKEQASKKKSGESRTMAIRVLDEKTGQPLPETTVHVRIWGFQSRESFPTKTYKTDNQGRAEIAIGHRIMILQIWLSKDAYVPQLLYFAQGSHEDGRRIPDKYEFQLQPGSKLGGVVVDTSGNPVSGAKVQVTVQVDSANGSAGPKPIISNGLASGEDAAVTGVDGRWEITNAPPRKKGFDFKFKLQVSHPDFAGDTRWGELQGQQGITTDELRAGTAKLRLDRGIAVRGLITGPDDKPVTKRVVVWGDRRYGAKNEVLIDAKGRYETLRLKPGDYTHYGIGARIRAAATNCSGRPISARC